MLGVVDGHRVLAGEGHVRGQPVRGGDLRAQPHAALLQPRHARLGLNARTVASKVAVSGITLRRVPAVEQPDGDHHRVEDVELAGDHRLQGDHHLRGDHDRVGGRVRAGGVPADPAHGDEQAGRRGHQRPAPGGEHPPRQDAGEHVQPVRGRHPRPGRVQHPLGEHRGGAVVPLLARLEHEHHVAGQLVAVPAEQHGPPRPARRCAGRGRRRASPRRVRRTRSRSPRSPAGRPCRPAAALPERVTAGRRAAPRRPRSAPGRGSARAGYRPGRR